MCLSGIDAIYLADQMIQAGDAEVVVAGGMESMTKAPYLLPKAREGYRMGNGELLDSMIDDGLWCAFDAVHMGAGTERYTGELGGITREAQDDARGEEPRARRGRDEGRPASPRRSRRSRSRSARATRSLVDTDEGVRPGTTIESLGEPAARVREGRHHHRRQRVADLRRRRRGRRHESTAKAEELGLTPIAELRELRHGRRPRPVAAHTSRRARSSARSSPVDVKVTRPRPLRDQRGVRRGRPRVDAATSASPTTIVNVNGGAIALGHPIGMSGTRVVLTLINELRRRGGGLGAAALCGGGGQGEAAIVRDSSDALRSGVLLRRAVLVRARRAVGRPEHDQHDDADDRDQDDEQPPPLLSVSCSRRMPTAMPGMSTASA